jgi:hypothetical protein
MSASDFESKLLTVGLDTTRQKKRIEVINAVDKGRMLRQIRLNDPPFIVINLTQYASDSIYYLQHPADQMTEARITSSSP